MTMLTRFAGSPLFRIVVTGSPNACEQIAADPISRVTTVSSRRILASRGLAQMSLAMVRKIGFANQVQYEHFACPTRLVESHRDGIGIRQDDGKSHVVSIEKLSRHNPPGRFRSFGTYDSWVAYDGARRLRSSNVDAYHNEVLRRQLGIAVSERCGRGTLLRQNV